jgi:Cu-processing system permease protein
MSRIVKFIMLDIFKNRIILVYTIALAILSWGVFSIDDNSSKAALTLLNVILLVVPLVAVIFSTIYLYNSAEFIELLLSQPVKRSKIWSGLFSGICLSLCISFIIGAGIPIMLYLPALQGSMMLLSGIFISAVFVSIAFLSPVISRDKAKGIGMSVLLWLFFGLLFDGLILFLLFQFADYPIEKPMAIVTALNPIDLARIIILLHLDVSAMMGYTGAIYKDLFGTNTGIILSFILLLLWITIPFLISSLKFKKQDL